jgi:hypothetical protein
VTRKIGVLVSLLMFVCETFGLAAEAKSLRHHGSRISIAWPYGCAFYPIDDAAKNKHKLERDCAAALASVTGWPNAPERCDYDYGELSWGRCRTLGFCRCVPANSWSSSIAAPEATTPSRFTVLYDETKSPVTAKLLRFPYSACRPASSPQQS